MALTGLASQPRRLALLALLAEAGDKGMRRERLIAYLWPDADDERGRRSLAQALYSIRKELASDEVVTGTSDLRLNAEQITIDVAVFRRGLHEGDPATAVAAYGGPFLDGFWLSGFPELERWMEDQRRAFALDFASALERLALRTARDGDSAGAVGWWRKLAATDPTNGRIAVLLMDAMVASNDRVGALRYADVFESIYRQEMEDEPVGEIAAFIRRLRTEKPSQVPPVSAGGETAATAAMVAEASSSSIAPTDTPSPTSKLGHPIDERPTSDGVVTERTASSLAGSTFQKPGVRHPNWLAAAFIGVAAMLAVGVELWRNRSSSPQTDSNPVVAVGRVSDFGGSSNSAGSLADLLATNLARVEGMRVVSAARLQEISGSDTSLGGITSAAREAGAAELIEGTLFTLDNGRMRLDLRRVDLESGRIREAHRVEGADLFALVDSGTAKLVMTYGGRAPAGSISEVTTASPVAYQLYSTGLRQFYAGDIGGAERLFGAALREDPEFAMAAFYYARASNGGWTVMTERLKRAVDLSARASDRERLLIRAGWAGTNSSPELAAYAESLVTRYPDDVQGYLTRGIAAAQSGDRAAEMAALRRVIAMDSLGLIRGRSGCAACEATSQLIARYLELDSGSLAVAEARNWTKVQPKSVPAWRALGNALAAMQRDGDALSAFNTAFAIDSSVSGSAMIVAQHWIRTANYTRADSILHEIAGSAGRDTQDAREALWYLAISLRQQGRFAEALQFARQYRAATSKSLPSAAAGAATPTAVLEAQIDMEIGQPRTAAALFDSISRWRSDQPDPANVARNIAWIGTHVADALALANDTMRLASLEDSIRTFGARSAYPRDRLLHHHVHALRLLARQDNAGATQSFRAAIWSAPLGHTRTNLLMGQTLLRAGRAADAIPVLQAALRGSIEASNLYVTRTELHETLAQAWDAAGRPDSAATHYEIVARSWVNADPTLQFRRTASFRRAAELRKR